MQEIYVFYQGHNGVQLYGKIPQDYPNNGIVSKPIAFSYGTKENPIENHRTA